MISSELADCGGGKRQPAAADGSCGGGGGVERSDDTGSRELASGLVGNRQVEAGPPTQRRKRSNEPSKRNREKQRKPTMAEATVATAGDPEMEQRLEELTKENNALKNQLDEQIRLNSVIVANPTMASSKTLPEGTLPSTLPYELLERNSKHIERNVEPPAVEFCPFPSLMSERSAFSVIRSSEPTAEPPGMPPPPFGQQQQQAASAAASSLYPPPPNFFHFASESSSQQLEFIRLAAQLSPFSLFSPSHFLPCSTSATTTTLGFEQQQQQHLDLLDQLYRMPYQQHLQRLDSAEAAQQQRMAALSQPLTLDLPQQLANIRRKGIGIGVAGSNDGCQFSIQEPSTSNRSANGTEKFAFNISSNSSQSVIVDCGGWDAKKAMKATNSSRAAASTDEQQPSSSEKKQRQHRMAAQTSVITAAVAMPDQSISSSMEMQQTQPDSSTITLPLSSTNGMDQPKAAELMPDAAASSSSFLIADGQPPLIFPERKTVLEMATEVGGYIPSAAAGGGLLAHSAASALLPSFPSSTSTALPLFNPFAHLYLLREQQQQQQLNAAVAGMLEVMPSSSSASESAAEKAATQRNGTEKERNAPTEHQAKREKRLKAADGNGADGNGADGNGGGHGDGTCTSSSTRKTTVGPSSSSLASSSSAAASSTSALGSLLAAPSKRRTSPTVPASRTELCSGLATTTTVIDSHGQQAEAGRTAAANEKEQASERDRLKQQQQQQQREKEKAAAASSDSEQSTTGTGGQHSPNSMDSLLHSTSNSMSPSSTLPGAGSTMTTICGSDRTRRSSSSPSGNSGCSGDDSLADPFLLIDNGGKGPAEAGTSAQKRPKTASGGGCGSHSSAGANDMDRQSPAAGGSMRLKLRTSEDLERYMDRRRRNNEAAKRCRANRRAVFEFRSRRAQLLEAENGELRQEMLKLNSELDQLKAIIAANAAAAQQTHRLMPNI